LEVVLKQRLKLKNENDLVYDCYQTTIGFDESSENIIYIFNEFLTQAIFKISS